MNDMDSSTFLFHSPGLRWLVKLWYSDQLVVAYILKGLNKIRSLGRGQKK